MNIVYKNRYNDSIEFDDSRDGQVLMKGSKFLRYGYDDSPKEVNMVDPSGGPYITIGTNLNMFFNDNIDRVVSEIEILETSNIFGEPVNVLFTLKK